MTGLNLPASSRVRARGRSRGGYLNGSTGLVEQVTTFGGWVPPTITVSLGVVEDSGGWGGGTTTYVPQANGATVNFGARRIGSFNESTTIRIANTGPNAIRNVRVAYQGAPVGEFGTTSSYAPTISAGSYFDIYPNFNPQGGGPRADRLWITGDGFENSPFELNLAGIGQISDSPWTYVADWTIMVFTEWSPRRVVAP